ncbi:MAG: histidinol-phosphate transaminase [Candidatus Krumholzibacteria bacterium]|nr:histidinol-phosphate transaminase [Candidatus Krumholzibacteria bacterium]
MSIVDLMQPHLKNVKPYVPGKPIEELRRERNIQGEIIKLASNENPYEPIEEARQAIIEELSEINRYPDSGCYNLCIELAKHHGVNPNQIFIGNGSNEILDLLVRAFVGGSDEIVYAWPSFQVYPIVSQLAGVKSVQVPLKDYRLDLPSMRAAVTRETKLVIICNPNNPTSTYVSKSEVDLLVEDLPKEVLVAFDEAYYEYVAAADFPDTPDLLSKHPNVIVLRTFSKIHSLAGVRIGYSLSHEDVVTCLNKVRQPFNVNSIAQAAARAALKHMDKIRVRVKENRDELDFVRVELQKLGFVVPPSQTNFLLAVPPPGNSAIIEQLMQKGIIVRPMKPFGLGEDSFRVTVGTPYENRKFIETLKELV